MALEYNTQRTSLKLREYGRNVQNLILSLKTIENEEEKNRKAKTIIELMKVINPDLNRDSSENDQKIWDDLHIISNFELEVESPYPKPEKEVLERKPERMKYYSNEIKYRHYGRSVELLIDEALEINDPKEIEGAVVIIGRLMKGFYNTWNRDSIDDEQILKNIKRLSNNKLDINIETVKELGLFDTERRNSGSRRYSNTRARNNKNGAKSGSRRSFSQNSKSKRRI